MNRITRLLPTSTTVLGPNRVEAIAGTSAKARDGHIVDMRGMDLSAFMRSGTILWGHDPDQPVGVPVSCSVDSAGNLRVTVDFAPEGTSPRADEIRNLVKAGIVRNMSIGFDPIDMEPLDPRNPRGGQRITRCELLEISFVSVPADTGAVVTARAGRSGKTLSGANANALRQAHRLADQCRSTIEGVLGDAGEMGEPDGDEFAQRQRDLRRMEVQHLQNSAPIISPEHARRLRQLSALELSPANLAVIANDREHRQRELRALERRMR